jgi:chromosome segregation ATPase
MFVLYEISSKLEYFKASFEEVERKHSEARSKMGKYEEDIDKIRKALGELKMNEILGD